MNNYYQLKVVNRPLYYIELISCLNNLAENLNNIDIKDTFNDTDLNFINNIKNFRIKGREFFEFALCIDELDKVDCIISQIDCMSNVDFIYIFFGDSLSKEEVELIYKDYSALNEVLHKNNQSSSFNLYEIEILFKNTESFKKDFFNILRKLDKFIKGENIIDGDIYNEKIKKIALELKEKTPLNIAQDIMGKKFKRVYDFNYYLFVPSFYFKHKPMRTFNSTSQLLIYPVKPSDSSIDSNELAKILKIISVKSRLDIIKAISNQSCSGKELASKIGVSTPTISHHLDQLKSIGLIYEEREKNTKYFTLNKNTYKEIINNLNNYL